MFENIEAKSQLIFEVNFKRYFWVFELSVWLWPNFVFFFLFFFNIFLYFLYFSFWLSQNENLNTLRLSSNLLLRSTIWVICELFTFQYDFGPILSFFWQFFFIFLNFFVTLTQYECLKTLMPCLSLHLRSIVWVISESLMFPSDFGPIFVFLAVFGGFFLSFWLKLSV